MNAIDLENLFKEKEFAEVPIPLLKKFDLYQDYFVELLDVLKAYMEPLDIGISKWTIEEVVLKNFNLLEYLLLKRYLIESEFFKELAIKYARKSGLQRVECFIFIVDKGYDEDHLLKELNNVIYMHQNGNDKIIYGDKKYQIITLNCKKEK